uniref:Andropin n=1 Tax=Drosophila orena TaxID=7233 RepID=ANDP_DROOR|nr:RecName: Full=Andropin; Flags: Precursor [Drosophila orena]BAB78550.1 andropin [Drosophila orena]
MKYFLVLVVLTLILAISVGQSDALFVDIIDNVENAIHKAAKTGIGMVKPIENIFIPNQQKKSTEASN